MAACGRDEVRSPLFEPSCHSLILLSWCRINGHVRQRKHWTRPDKYEGKRVSPTEIRPFVFAPIALTDDASEAVRDEAIIKGLGTIRLEFYRVVYEGRAQRKESYAVNLKQQVSLHAIGFVKVFAQESDGPGLSLSTKSARKLP